MESTGCYEREKEFIDPPPFSAGKEYYHQYPGMLCQSKRRIIILTRAESCMKGNGIVSFAAEDRNTWGKMFNEIHQYFYTGY